MKRRLTDIYSILVGVLNNEIEGEPTIFLPDQIPDEDVGKSMSYFAPMLVENGFLREVESQADFKNFKCYRITWKGHCFLDMLTIWLDTQERGDSLEMLVADLAVSGFH